MSNTDMTKREALWWRHVMPYSIWWCRDGRVVLFNRCYKPIAEWSPQRGHRVPERSLSLALPYEHWQPVTAEADVYEYVHQQWLYSDGSAPWLPGIRGQQAAIRVMLVFVDFLDGKMPKRVR